MEPLKELFLKLGLDWNGSSFASAQIAVDALEFVARKLVDAFVAVGRYAVNAVLGTAHLADSLDEASAKTSMSTTALQEWSYAAGLSGVSTEQLYSAIGILSSNMGKALAGSEEAGAIFAKMGVKLRTTTGEVKTTDEVLGELADKFKAMPDDFRRVAAARELFGRAGAELLPTLIQGRHSIAQLREEAQKLGIVLDEQTIATGAKLQDNLDRLSAAWGSFARDVGGPIIEAIAPLVEQLVEWVKANRELIRSRLQTFARQVGSALVFAAKALSRMVNAITLFVSVIKTAGIALLAFFAAQQLVNVGLLQTVVNFALNTAAALAYGAISVATALKTAAAWALANAPILLTAALFTLLALAVEDVYTFLKGGDSVIGELGPKWTKFLDSMLQVKTTDPVWLVWLKKALEVVLDLQGAWNKLVSMFNRDVLFVNFVRGVASLTGASKTTVEEISPSQSQFFQEPTEAFGGGASPAASAAASPRGAQGRVLAPRFHAPISVTAAPGQNPQEVAGAVREQLDDFWDSKMRDGAEAVPGWEGG